jgi:hypothetical protein
VTEYRRVEVVRTTVRYEFDAPMSAKTVGIALAWVAQEFKKLNGRPLEFDDDYWLEPMDDAVAFVFAVVKVAGVEMDHD